MKFMELAPGARFRLSKPPYGHMAGLFYKCKPMPYRRKGSKPSVFNALRCDSLNLRERIWVNGHWEVEAM